MARQAFELTAKRDLTSSKILDLCAGCGIVGLDFLFHRHKAGLTQPLSTDFVEVQEVYKTHFNQNTNEFKKIIGTQPYLQLINTNYENLQQPEYKDRYDLVLCNPPYFRLGQGALSPSEFKNRCRFFIDSDFKQLLASLEACTALGAEVYILLNSLSEHGIDLETEIRQFAPRFKSEKIGLIRSTDFWLLKKLL